MAFVGHSAAESSSEIKENFGGKDVSFENLLTCSFDVTDPACAIKVKTNGSLPLYSVITTSGQIVGNYKVTDVSSISKLAF